MAEAGSGGGAGGTVPWRAFLVETEQRLAAAGADTAAVDARRIVEQVSGHEGASLVLALDEPATVRGVTALDAMVARRAAGEPLQYVLGRWGFRSLDLLVDRRVLIPRPETEEVAGWAIDEVHRIQSGDPTAPVTVVDLGTGSGAIALSVAVEVPAAIVWATDRSADALAVARANLAGIGRPAARVRLVEGDWFGALPAELAGVVDVVVSNPPYVAAGDDLPPVVADWEPTGALVAGPDGLEDVAAIIERAPQWLAPGGSLVVELAPAQGEQAAGLARDAGFGEVELRTDLAGRTRAVVTRR